MAWRCIPYDTRLQNKSKDTNNPITSALHSIPVDWLHESAPAAHVWPGQSTLCLVLCSYAHIPPSSSNTRPASRDFQTLWRAFQRTPRIVLLATPQLLPPQPRSLLFAFASGLAHRQCPTHHHRSPASCIGRPFVHRSQRRVTSPYSHWSRAFVRKPSGLLLVTREQSPLDTRTHWISSTQHPVSDTRNTEIILFQNIHLPALVTFHSHDIQLFSFSPDLQWPSDTAVIAQHPKGGP